MTSRQGWASGPGLVYFHGDDKDSDMFHTTVTFEDDGGKTALTMRAVLDSLPPRYRRILRLRYYEGCSIAEVAESLGVKPKYAQKLVSKCIKKAEKNYLAKGRTACPPAPHKPASPNS